MQFVPLRPPSFSVGTDTSGNREATRRGRTRAPPRENERGRERSEKNRKATKAGELRAEPIDFSSPSAYKCILMQKKKSAMHTKRFLKAVSVVLGLIFLFSILTVESHARETGSLAAKLPTIIDGTIEFAVAINDKVDFYVFRAIEYLPLAFEVLIIHKAATPPQVYRGPPVFTF